MVDERPTPDQAAALLAEADSSSLTRERDRGPWTLVALTFGVVWAAISAVTSFGRSSPSYPLILGGTLLVAVVVVGWIGSWARRRTTSTPRAGAPSWLLLSALPVAVNVGGDILLELAGVDRSSVVVGTTLAVAVALPCLAVAHRVWWGAWIPVGGRR